MTPIYKSLEGERAVRERYLRFLERWPLPNRQLRVPTREGETFILACGPENAPPLVLLHGSGGNAAMWLGDIAAWASHFRVYAIDMIGEPGLSAPSRPSLASEAHALWLDDVIRALSVDRVSIVGVSLGGWLGIDYASRRPGRVERLAVLCPGGVGRQKIGILLKLIPLRMCGRWGAQKARDLVLGKMPAEIPPAVRHFIDFVALIHDNFRPRMAKLPLFSDEALCRLTMRVMAVVGGRDVLLDSAETKRRLERTLAQPDIRYLPEAGHLIPGQTAAILDFLLHAKMPCRASSPGPLDNVLVD